MNIYRFADKMAIKVIKQRMTIVALSTATGILGGALIVEKVKNVVLSKKTEKTEESA